MAGEVKKVRKVRFLEQIVFWKGVNISSKKKKNPTTKNKSLNQTSSTCEEIIAEYTFEWNEGVKMTNMNGHNVQVVQLLVEQATKKFSVYS